MGYLDKLDWYYEGCANSVEQIRGIRTNLDLDVTLTSCEKFDHLFKNEFVKTYNKEHKKTFWKRNNFKGRTMTGYVAQMFYLILVTSDNYNFESLQKVIQKITKIATRRRYNRVATEVSESENKYILKIMVDGTEPLSYSIEDKQSYVVCLSDLLTTCFNTSGNKMVYNFYKTYLQHEIMKIETDTEITPYVEWAPNLFLRDYFEPTPNVETLKPTKSHIQSNLDLDRYEKIRLTNEELLDGKQQKSQGIDLEAQKKKEDEFLQGTLVSAMGVMTTRPKSKV